MSYSEPVCTGCLPLIYSGNPGVNGVSYRERGVSTYDFVAPEDMVHTLPDCESSVYILTPLSVRCAMYPQCLSYREGCLYTHTRLSL